MAALLRILIKVIAGLVAGVVLIALAVIIFVGFTGFGANFAVQQVTQRIASPDFAVHVGRVSAPLTGHFTVESVTVSDIDGPYVSVDDVVLDWSPLALLRGNFVAETLSAQNVALDRLPAAGEDKAEKSSDAGGGFSLPIGIKIASFDFPQIDIAAPVLGEDYPLSAAGKLTAATDTISASLDARHRARPSTYVKADVEYAPADNRLDLDAEVNEPQGGVIATLMQLPGAPALNIALGGDGPLSDWQGKVTAELSGAPLGEIDIHHQLDSANERLITVSGTGQFAPLTPEAFASLVEGTTNLDIAVSLSPSGRIAISKGNITTGSFTLAASGAYDPAGNNDLKATLNGTDGPVPFSWPLGENMLDLAISNASIALTGAAENADLQTSVTLDRLSMPDISVGGLALVASGTGLNLANRSGTLDTALTVETLSFENENLNQLVKAPISLSAPVSLSGSRIEIASAELESGSIGGTASVAYDMDAQNASGNARLFVLADALPAPAAGMIEGMTEIETGFSADLADASYTLSDLHIKNSLVDATGDVSLADGAIDASLKAALTELGTFAPQVGGAAEISASATGALSAPDIEATATADNLVISGETLKDFSLSLKGKADPAAPSGSISAKGTYADAPLTLAADVTSTDGRINISGLEGAVGGNTLSGDLTLNESFLPAGGINFDFPDLKLLAGLAGQDASGGISGRIALDNAGNALGLSLDAAGNRLSFSTITAENIDADMTVADLSELKANGKITVGSVSTSGQRVSNIVLSASNEGAQTTFDLSADYDGQPVSTEIRVTRAETMDIEILRLEGSPMSLALKLAEPGRITIADGTADIKNLRIGIGGGTVSARGSVGESMDMTVNIANVGASIANAFVPNLGLQGTVSGTITASGALSNPAASYDLSWNNANLTQASAIGGQPFSLSTSGRYENNRVTTDTTVTNAQGLTARANGSVGLGANMPLDISVTGRLPLALASVAAANAGFAVSGNADVNMSIGGSVKAPSYSGGMDVNITSVTDLRRNLRVNDIRGRISLSGDRMVVENITGRLAAGGTMTTSGSISLAGDLQASLRLDANDAVINDGRLLTTTVNGTVTLEGPLLGQPTVSGRLNLGRTAIVIPDRLPASISEIDIVHEYASEAVRRQAQELSPQQTTDARSSFNLDITISAPNAIFVRGRGVDAELGGSISVSGTTANPIITGGFDLIRGRLSILNRRFDFDRGRITFGGALVPLIDLQTRTTAGSTAITITLQGVATDPQVSLSSVPALPNDEILAQLLFNQSSSGLSALQIAQLADAVIQLTGGTDQSLFGSIRDVLGIDNLDVSTDSDGNTAVSVGKYLNSNTYVEIEQSRDSGTKASVNIDIGRNFIVKGSAGSRGETSGGIFYEKEY
ncbi:translocation/assembly module TamB domain-containing protein [Martelella mangrovi]|uniref:Translocation and assembly module TamB n=1 Tax=Martelella mangrovi TaxID=1397477 RepID=A0ABV2IFI5_9HYPH